MNALSRAKIAGKLALKVVVTDYEHVAPLACGAVELDGIDLKLEREPSPVPALERTMNDPSVLAGELSFGRHVIRVAQGDRSWVGIPFFINRSFRHRCFFVRPDAGLAALADLAGKRVGTAGWAATGNIWSRAALREQGIDMRKVQWWIGPLQASQTNLPAQDVPAFAHATPSGIGLVDMLMAGQLDAIMYPTPPPGFCETGARIVRLLRDYRRAEQEYYRRTALYPGQHIIGVRRQVFEEHPWVARSLYDAFEHSRALWQRRHEQLAETSPWQLPDVEETLALMGVDWQRNGLDTNRKMIQTLCDEAHAQELLLKPIEAASVFAEAQLS